MDVATQPIDRLLVGVSAPIAILSLPSYLAYLKATLAREVRVIMTPNAAKLLPPLTAALLCDGVFLDGISSQKRPGHMELARWCDMFLVLPVPLTCSDRARTASRRTCSRRPCSPRRDPWPSVQI